MLDFYECGYNDPDDFECLFSLTDYDGWGFIVGLTPDWNMYDFWFKAYATACCETEYEKELFDAGYNYDCYVWVRDGNAYCEELAHFKAHDADEAERMFVIIAEALDF